MQQPSWVLIVDDEPMIVMYLKDLLADLGFEKMVSAYDLPTARGLVKDSTPALAILDVNIGQSLVFPFATLLRACQVPILFCSGRSPREFPEDWSGYPLITKPFDTKAISAALTALERTPVGEGVAAIHHARHQNCRAGAVPRGS